MDVATIPDIKASLSGSFTVADRITLSACDISDAKFPPKPTTDSLGVNVFLQDVTKPFPQEMHGRLNLVHASLLYFALTEEGWDSALKNIDDLLKPGGIFLLMEYDSLSSMQPPDQPVSGNEICDISAYLQSKSSIVYRANSLLVYSAERNGFIWGNCAPLPEIFKLAQLEIVSMKYFDLPFGGARSDRLSKDYALENASLVFDTLSRMLLSQNDLEIPRGQKITTDEERKKALAELVRDIAQEGCISRLAEWVACRPLT